ncbi:hypothetical protein V1291_005057 [Nitrobacteraceae bacterium AZCC 1564]
MERILGGCLCGAVRFAVAGNLASAAYCHCADCRKCTGSAFNVSVPVAVQDFELLSGQTNGFTKIADSGRELTRHFCPGCGSPLFTSSPRHPDRIYVKAGSFDDPSLIAPAYQSWVNSSVAWAKIPADLPSFGGSNDQRNSAHYGLPPYLDGSL